MGLEGVFGVEQGEGFGVDGVGGEEDGGVDFLGVGEDEEVGVDLEAEFWGEGC